MQLSRNFKQAESFVKSGEVWTSARFIDEVQEDSADAAGIA